MAQSPQFKVYRNGEYVAACKYAEDAAAMVSLTPSGEIKYGHRLVVWREGSEEFSAGNSYDGAAAVMFERIQKENIRGLLRAGHTPEQIEKLLARA